MDVDPEKMSLLAPVEEEKDDLETLDAVAKARSIYIEPDTQSTDVEFHQALALRSVMSNSTVYCIVLLVLGGFIVMGAALLGLLLAPPQRIPLRGYKVTTSEVPPMQWWNNAIHTDDWTIISARSVSPVHLDNSTALWVFGETVYVPNVTANGKPKNVTIPSSVLFLSIDPASRNIVNAYFITDEDGFPRPLIEVSTNSTAIVPTASVVLEGTYYQWYRSVNRSTGFHYSAGLAIDSNVDPFVDLIPVFPPVANITPPTFAALNGTDGKYVYLFYAKQDALISTATLLYVGRLSSSQLSNSSFPVEFWSGGDAWGSLDTAIPTLDSVGTSFAVVWNAFAQLYLTLDTGPGVRAVLRSSTSLWKDYTLPMTLYPNTQSPDALSHAQWHPELFQENGRVMYASVYAGPKTYPTILRIELTPDSS